ncbi:MAG: GNAT family N-acetyltransferase [Bacteroidota bacterium]|nr:GNAT family N-acetyltransferase [Bacteroidota bacterium]
MSIQNEGDFTEYLFEPINQTHYHYFQELFFYAFKTTITIRQIELKFNTKVLGAEVIGYIAIDKKNGVAAAYYGVFPVQLTDHETVIQAAQSGDTMTHPHHRKKGLFVHLAQLTFSTCRKKNIKIVFGFPNQFSYPGLVKRLSWQHVDNIVRWDLKLNIKTFPLPKLLLKNHNLFKTYLTYARAITKKVSIEVTEFTNKYETTLPKVLRDKNYLLYKKVKDKVFIRLDNVILWIKFSDVLLIGDVDNYTAITGKTISKIKKLAFLLGYNTVSFYWNESLQPPSFLRYFKKHSKLPSCSLSLDQPIFPNILFTAADFDTW